jgi:hypothetical protein
MKRIAYLLAILVAAATFAGPLRAQQTESLGDYARTIRKEKDKQPPTSKKYDNDNLPRNDSLSVVGNAPEQPADNAAAANTEQPSAEAAPATAPAASAPSAAAEQQKTNDSWKERIADQKNQIELMSRELDVMQREYRLRAAAFYADAGNRLRNSGAWDKEDAQYKQQIAAKQKAIDAAKQQLSDLQEQARKAGVPSSARQ